MANGRVCCILGVCCKGAKQRDALVNALKQEGGCKDAQASSIADWLLATFDLAPAGSLTSLKAGIAEMVRTHPDQPA